MMGDPLHSSVCPPTAREREQGGERRHLTRGDCFTQFNSKRDTKTHNNTCLAEKVQVEEFRMRESEESERSSYSSSGE